MGKKKTIDLTEALLGTKKQRRADRDRRNARGAVFRVKKRLQVTIDEPGAAWTLAGHIVDVIEDEMRKNSFKPSLQTRERRGRSHKAERYPEGPPNPAGPYGFDSGYLASHLKDNMERGAKDVFVNVPPNRAKAAFVVRRASPTARGEVSSSGRRGMKKGLEAVLKEMLKKARNL